MNRTRRRRLCPWKALLLVGAVLSVLDLASSQEEPEEEEDETVGEDLTPYPIPEGMELPPIVSTRRERFPSIDERVKVYMSNWYLPPCNDQGLVKYKYVFNDATASGAATPSVWLQEPQNLVGTNSTSYVVHSRVAADTAFFLNRTSLSECGYDPTVKEQSKLNQIKNMRNMYCPDASSMLLTALDHVTWERGRRIDDHVPIVMQFGDMRFSHVYRYMNTPLIKKFRVATTKSELDKQTQSALKLSNDPLRQCLEVRVKMQTALNLPSLEPVVWKLATPRHFGLLDRVYRSDTPWELKMDMAIFRGQLTGSVDGFDRKATPEQNCMTLRRCRLVYMNANSTYVDALLTSTRDRIPNKINGVKVVSRKVSLDYLLKYKGIIMLEGNDVASGLKWALLSQSVVLMPIPKHTSWAMEELLEPWVHYVPLNADASDVEEKMRWVVEHDEHARRIAHRGSLWMQDLVFHPESLEDDREIQEEILRRYMAHFAPLSDSESMDAVAPLVRSS
jgi:Glycosyl transferase family 90